MQIWNICLNLLRVLNGLSLLVSLRVRIPICFTFICFKRLVSLVRGRQFVNISWETASIALFSLRYRARGDMGAKKRNTSSEVCHKKYKTHCPTLSSPTSRPSIILSCGHAPCAPQPRSHGNTGQYNGL